MLIGYARVSRADRSQVLDLQVDALLAAGVDRQDIHTDRISRRKDQRPGLNACGEVLPQTDEACAFCAGHTKFDSSVKILAAQEVA